MAKEKTEKTNVMRLLEQKGIPYTPHDYRASGAVGGTSGTTGLVFCPQPVRASSSVNIKISFFIGKPP